MNEVLTIWQGLMEGTSSHQGNVRPADCTSPLTPTIFHEPWWLSTVSRGQYQEVKTFRAGREVGRLPYVLATRHGRKQVGMPMLTHFLGPAVDAGEGSETTRLLNRLSIMRDLIVQLPKVSNVTFKLHRDMQDSLAFQALGFRSGVQFTCEIPPAPPSVQWEGMRDKTRNVIRRARERFEPREFMDPDSFVSFYERNLAARALRNVYDSGICSAVIVECLQRKRGRVLVATDQQGALCAGIFTVWDESAEYYLMSTRAHDSGNGAVSMLLWEAIQGAASRGRTFDFGGISQAGDILFFAGFGGEVKPRHVVSRNSLLGSIARLARHRRYRHLVFHELF